MIDEDDYHSREWIWDFAEDAGFAIDDDGEIYLPDNGEDMDEVLETFANIVAHVAINNYVAKMCEDLRG